MATPEEIQKVKDGFDQLSAAVDGGVGEGNLQIIMQSMKGFLGGVLEELTKQFGAVKQYMKQDQKIMTRSWRESTVFSKN